VTNWGQTNRAGGFRALEPGEIARMRLDAVNREREKMSTPKRLPVRGRIGSVALTGILLAWSGSAAADLIHVDMSSYFNADVIVNGADKDLDTVQDGMDSTRCFLTQNAADSLGGDDANGLPDNGFFPATAEHPDIQLGYHDLSDGNNAWQARNEGDKVMVDVPDGKFDQMYLFGSSAVEQGLSRFSEAEVQLIYADPPPTDSSVLIRDWLRRDFLGLPIGEFFLANGLDRVNADGTGFEDRDDPAIFGVELNPDPTRVLVAIMITKVDDNTDRYINVFGLTGEGQLVPEPASLLLLAGAALLRRGRR